MPQIQKQGRIMDASYAATTAITSDDIYDGRSESKKAVLYVYSTQAGTVQAQYIDNVGIARNLTAALAVAATDLTVLNFDYQVPRLRAVFTPNAATAGTVTIDAYQS